MRSTSNDTRTELISFASTFYFAVVIGCAIAHAALSAWIRYHVSLNDFWAIYYIVTRLDFAEPATLQNGFFPIGYPLLLWLSPQSEITTAFFLNTVAVVALLTSMGAIARITLGSTWAGVVALSLVFIPSLSRYAFVPSPDMLMVALLALSGVSLAWVLSNDREPPVGWILVGVFAGLCCADALARAGNSASVFWRVVRG